MAQATARSSTVASRLKPAGKPFLGMLDAVTIDSSPDFSFDGAITVAEATALLRLHRASVARGEARGRRAPAHQVPTQQEVDAILIKRIRMVKRQRAVRAVGDPPPSKGTA